MEEKIEDSNNLLSKEECLFERDEEGSLIGKKIILETLDDKPSVIIKPLTRGKLMSIFQKAKDGSQEEKTRSSPTAKKFR